MIGTLDATGPDAPHRPGKDQHKHEEECARYLEPESAADPAKGPEKAADAARQASAGLPGSASRRALFCSLVRLGSVQRLSSGISHSVCSIGIRGSGGDALAGYASGNPQASTQKAPYALRSHFVMMVAAPVAEPLFLFFCNSLLLWNGNGSKVEKSEAATRAS